MLAFCSVARVDAGPTAALALPCREMLERPSLGIVAAQSATLLESGEGDEDERVTRNGENVC